MNFLRNFGRQTRALTNQDNQAQQSAAASHQVLALANLRGTFITLQNSPFSPGSNQDTTQFDTALHYFLQAFCSNQPASPGSAGAPELTRYMYTAVHNHNVTQKFPDNEKFLRFLCQVLVDNIQEKRYFGVTCIDAALREYMAF